MARQTFISYKYDEAQDLRDQILEVLGDDARFYKGETSESPDRTDQTTETIKNALKDMLYSTSVLIIIASPNMNTSNWIEWEIQYALREQKRNVTTSKPNGALVVIKSVEGSYDWLMESIKGDDGCVYRRYNTELLPEIVNLNRFNRKKAVYACEHCATYSSNEGSYISIVTQEEFMSNPSLYIENAYAKCQDLDSFNIRKKNP